MRQFVAWNFLARRLDSAQIVGRNRSFGDLFSGFEKYGKTTRRAQFLAEMEQVVLWSQLCALVEPVYPKGSSSEGGRPPVPFERMFRIYTLQLWSTCRIRPRRKPCTTRRPCIASRALTWVGSWRPMKRRCANSVTFWRSTSSGRLFKAVNRHLHEQGIKVSRGTIVDATIISAPSSTKNKSGGRDHEGSVSWPGEKPQPYAGDLRVGEPIHGSTPILTG